MVLLAPRIYGCVVYVHLHPYQRTKLEPRALKCIFVGYGITQKGYKCYDPFSRRFYISMDVIFHEHELFCQLPTTDSSLQGGSREEVINHEELRAFFPEDTEENSFHDSTTSLDNPTPLSQSSCETPLKVSTDPNSTIIDDASIESQVSQYCLPSCSTYGIPPIKYKLDLKAKTRYPISNHVSFQRLSKSYASYVLQLSSISIPSKL